MRDNRKRVIAFEVEKHPAGEWCVWARHADQSRAVMGTGCKTRSDAEEEARCLRIAYDLPAVAEKEG
jgi:hypothetical protein